MQQPTRIPPGQYLVDQLPVLHAGDLPSVQTQSWRLRVAGLVQQPLTLTYQDLQALPAVEQVSDIHCVTRWTKLDTRWKGVRVREVLRQAGILPEARYSVIRAEGDWTTNLPIEELVRDDVLLAYENEGLPLDLEHGGPVRLLIPRLYFWKSAKWLTEVELTADLRLGYWESRGYHPLGDPWLEQRYA